MATTSTSKFSVITNITRIQL